MYSNCRIKNDPWPSKSFKASLIWTIVENTSERLTEAARKICSSKSIPCQGICNWNTVEAIKHFVIKTVCFDYLDVTMSTDGKNRWGAVCTSVLISTIVEKSQFHRISRTGYHFQNEKKIAVHSNICSTYRVQNEKKCTLWMACSWKCRK